jgi:hypothetical protein
MNYICKWKMIYSTSSFAVLRCGYIRLEIISHPPHVTETNELITIICILVEIYRLDLLAYSNS